VGDNVGNWPHVGGRTGSLGGMATGGKAHGNGMFDGDGALGVERARSGGSYHAQEGCGVRATRRGVA
jgi:hypothetical protein